MKNTIKVLGIIAIVALIGCIFTSCEEEEKENDGITISGTPKIGNKITAKISGKYLSGPRWEISENGGVTWINLTSTSNDSPIGTNEKEITIPATAKWIEGGTEGKFIRAWIYLNSSDTIRSNVLGPIQP